MWSAVVLLGYVSPQWNNVHELFIGVGVHIWKSQTLQLTTNLAKIISIKESLLKSEVACE